MRTKKAAIMGFIAAAALVIVAVTASTLRISGLFDDTATVANGPINWEEIVSAEWDFTAILPTPIEHKKTSVETPFDEAPLESYAGSAGPARFTVAVAEYDPQVAIEFSEEQRYESSDKETPKRLGGELAHSAPIRQHGVTGWEQIIDVPGKATLHTRAFLIGNRSYQIQIACPSDYSLDPNVKERFLDSLVIKYRPSRK